MIKCLSDAKTKTGEGVVFGIPINQTVDPHRKRSTTGLGLTYFNMQIFLYNCCG